MNSKYEEFLIKYGATEINHYSLVNNYGYTFNLNGVRYNIIFWANCYGVEINKFEIMPKSKDDINLPILEKIENDFNNLI